MPPRPMRDTRAAPLCAPRGAGPATGIRSGARDRGRGPRNGRSGVERRGLGDVGQCHPVVPGLCGPGDLRQIVGVALDERHVFDRTFTADRPPALDRRRADEQCPAMGQCAVDGRTVQRIGGRGPNAEGAPSSATAWSAAPRPPRVATSGYGTAGSGCATMTSDCAAATVGWRVAAFEPASVSTGSTMTLTGRPAGASAVRCRCCGPPVTTWPTSTVTC